MECKNILEDGTEDAPLLFICFLILNLLATLVIGQLPLLIHFLVPMFAHSHLSSDFRFHLGRVLHSIRRKYFHQIAQTNCINEVRVSDDNQQTGKSNNTDL